jgi:hypothetical protein
MISSRTSLKLSCVFRFFSGVFDFGGGGTRAPSVSFELEGKKKRGDKRRSRTRRRRRRKLKEEEEEEEENSKKKKKLLLSYRA